MKGNLALFDFDGTITTKDTLLEFIKFYKGTVPFYKGLLLLSPMLVLFKLKFIRNWRAKEIMLSFFFSGTPVEDFDAKCVLFAEKIIPSLIRPNALRHLKEHQQNGDKVVIVSASTENWIKPWANSLGVDLIGTLLEVTDGKITGKIKGRNCYGAEKVVRVKEYLKGETYDHIYAYGDSSGDNELLKYATHPHYRYFH